ncbi:MAG: helix-turn-helix domain-containing protein [Planctomycetaceae bacterium]|nr:helix-turn-helix domain-containing protein [Planctomycetaceae bacterium]
MVRSGPISVRTFDFKSDVRFSTPIQTSSRVNIQSGTILALWKKLAYFFLDAFPEPGILFATDRDTSGIMFGGVFTGGVNMLESQKFLEVIRLLRERKHSQRKIAQMMGVSRGTVSAIARGKQRRDFTENVKIHPKGPWVRCPKCGGKTQMPCTACYLKKMIGIRSKDSSWNISVHKGGLLDIELKGWQLRRYLKLRKWREEQLDPHFDVIPDHWPWSNEK